MDEDILKNHDAVNEDNYRALCRQMDVLGFTDWELKLDLRAAMEAGQPSVELYTPKGGFRMFDDRFGYLFVINRYGDDYVWKETAASLHRNLPIRHENIDGLDTGELERRMKPINWQVDYHDLSNNDGKGNQELLQAFIRVRDILGDLVKLQQSNNERGIEISLQLIKRYLIAGPNGRRYQLDDYMSKLSPPQTWSFDMVARPFSYREMYHLLCGRAVRKRVVDLLPGKRYKWYRLNIDYRGIGACDTMLEYPDFDYLPQLRKMPCSELEGHGLHSAMKQLHAGELLHLSSPQGSVTVSIDPAGQLVLGLDEYHEPLEPDRLLRMFVPVHPTQEIPVQQPEPRQSLARRFIARLQRGDAVPKRKLP